MSWVERLSPILSGKHIVEPFCGSAVLSSSLASSATLNDLDPYIVKILEHFDQQIVPEVFTLEDYYRVRSQENWWRYAFCLQRMSFSGVFRYSKNGYNVPAKKQYISEVRLQPVYERALSRWYELTPLVTNTDYADVPILTDAVVVVDPPYENTQAAYNKKSFDYERYWQWIRSLEGRGTPVLVFDALANLERQGLRVVGTRKMRVNGSRDGSVEALAVLNIDPDLVDSNTPAEPLSLFS